MNRKNFISMLVPAAGLMEQELAAKLQQNAGTAPVIPAYLQKGYTIGITCPAGFITMEEIQPALKKIQEWGFATRIGSTVGKRDFGFGGTDNERLQDLQAMLDDPGIRAILCARGGYGAVRIIDQVDFGRFLLYPKWIIGFSDITVIHSQLNRQGVASIHSKMCNSFPDNWDLAEPVQKDSITSIQRCLAGEKMSYPCLPNGKNKMGKGKGVLVGGNLKTLESLAGSGSDISTNNKILFVEDTGEYLYSIDRMFWNLKRTGKLSRLQGLVIGGFRIKKDDPGEEFGKTLEDIVLEKVSPYNYPVCFDFPVGHQINNFALKCGVPHVLEVSNGAALLIEAL